MATMLASRKAFSSRLMQKLITPFRPLTTASSTIRSFNTNVQVSDQSSHDDGLYIDRSSERSISRRGGRDDSIVSDVLDPFFPSRSLSQVLNLMDQMMENPFAALSRGMGGGSRRGFDVREDKDALYLRVDMPGLGKEDVKVFVEQNTLIIKGGGDKEPGDDSDRESGRRYSSRIDLPSELYKLDEIKAEMKNGVLKVLVLGMYNQSPTSARYVKDHGHISCTKYSIGMRLLGSVQTQSGQYHTACTFKREV